jgi:hypothetical protein
MQKSKEMLEGERWLRKHEKELPQMDVGEYLLGEEGRRGPKLVLGGEEDRHTGELGIRKRKYDSSTSEKEDARTTVPVHRKGYALNLWREAFVFGTGDFDEAETLSRIATLEKRLASYDDTRQTAEGKRELQDELECEKEWHQLFWGIATPRKTEEVSQYWLNFCGFTDPRTAIKEYQYAVLAAARLTRIQLKTVLMHPQSTTQAEVASKLRKSQQAVSKALSSGIKKITGVRRELGGPHKGLFFEMLHWVDTQGLSDWGKQILQKSGELPSNCRRCKHNNVATGILCMT